MVIAGLIGCAATVVSYLVYRRQRSSFERSWQSLSPAVPDDKKLEGALYRGASVPSEETQAQSRRALALLPESLRIKSLQAFLSVAAGPAAVLPFALWPIAALGPWSGVVGALWGVSVGVLLRKDDQRALWGASLLLFPLVPFSVFAVVSCFFMLVPFRYVLDQKNRVGAEESERERHADPRFLGGSSEGRAAGIARRRGASTEITDASARDNSTVS